MRQLRYFFPFLIMFFVVSCKEQSNKYDISFQEQSFANDILATITMLNDSDVYVVGGENGEIYQLKNDTVIAHDTTDLARIYCLYADSDTLYAGVRNSGIIKLVRNGNQLKRIKEYNIPRKGTRYSPYAIIPYHGDTLIATTSNGLYYFSKSMSIKDTLDSIHYGEDAGKPFVFSSPITVDSNIYVGTKRGIIKIDAQSKTPTAQSLFDGKLDKKEIAKIEKDGKGTLYALSADPGNDTLYIFTNPDTIPIPKPLPFSALSFVIAEDKFYFVNERELHVISDLNDMDNSKKEGNHVFTQLPHALSPDARNLIVYDNHAMKIRIITQKALLSLPSENGIGKSKSKICGICFDEKSHSVYFQNDKNEIYKLKDSVALKIMELPSADEISSLSAYGETLYFISNHQQLKSIKDRGYLQTIWNNSPDEICNLPDKSTTMFVDDNYAYIGVRDTLLRISLLEKTEEPIVFGKDVKPYITNIKKDRKKVYASTLNDGLFVLGGDTLSPDVKFQNDFAFTNKGILLLNNHYLRYYKNDPKDSIVDSVALRGYERLFFSKEKQIGAAVNKSAIQYFRIDNGSLKLSRYESRPITPQACLLADDSILYLAADEGMLIVSLSDSLTTKPANFDHSDYAKTESVVLAGSLFFIVFLISVIILICILIRSHRRKLRERDNRIQEEKRHREEDYRSRVQGLIKTLDYIEDDSIKDNVRLLRTDISSKSVVLNEELNKRIQETAQQVAIGLLVVITEKQLPEIKEIAWFECENIKKDCYDCIAKADINKLLKRIINNKFFLKRVKYINERLFVYDNLANNGAVIEGVTSGLREEINNVRSAFREKSLIIAEESFSALEDKGNALSSEKSIRRIRVFVENLEKCSSVENQEKCFSSGNTIFESYVSEQLKSIKNKLEPNPSRETIENLLIEIKRICPACQLRKILFDILSTAQDLQKEVEEYHKLNRDYKKNKKIYDEPLRKHDNGIQTLRPEDRHRFIELKMKNEEIEKKRNEAEAKIVEKEKDRDSAVEAFYNIVGSLNNDEIALMNRMERFEKFAPTSYKSDSSVLPKMLVMIMAVPREKCRYQQYTSKLYNYLRLDNHRRSENMSRIKASLRELFNGNITIDDKARETLLYKLLEDCWNKVRD